MRTRNALLPDAPQIEKLIAAYSDAGVLLPRPLPEICEKIRDFVVVEDGGQVIGCGALHLYGPHLAEVRSIAVAAEHKRKGVGRRLIKALLREAGKHGVPGVCLFTRIPSFFGKMGFVEARREDLPDKIYKDCLNCPKLHACDEVAMLRGQLPEFAILEPRTERRPLYHIQV